MRSILSLFINLSNRVSKSRPNTLEPIFLMHCHFSPSTHTHINRFWPFFLYISKQFPIQIVEYWINRCAHCLQNHSKHHIVVWRPCAHSLSLTLCDFFDSFRRWKQILHSTFSFFISVDSIYFSCFSFEYHFPFSGRATTQKQLKCSYNY